MYLATSFSVYSAKFFFFLNMLESFFDILLNLLAFANFLLAELTEDDLLTELLGFCDEIDNENYEFVLRFCSLYDILDDLIFFEVGAWLCELSLYSESEIFFLISCDFFTDSKYTEELELISILDYDCELLD